MGGRKRELVAAACMVRFCLYASSKTSVYYIATKKVRTATRPRDAGACAARSFERKLPIYVFHTRIYIGVSMFF